jgi:hypothetical protein
LGNGGILRVEAEKKDAIWGKMISFQY